MTTDHTAPPPPAKKPPRGVFSFRISPVGLSRFIAAAKRRGIDQSTAAREALAEWTARNS